MSSPPRTRATYDDLLRVPEGRVAEIVDGELYSSPRPAPRHARAASELHVWIGASYGQGRGGPGGWLILFEPELHLGEEVLVPDLAGWRRERMSELPDTAFFPTAPDWLCEVVSPRTASLDRTRKMPHYARHGVASVWLVDPLAQTLEVLRLEAGAFRLVATHGAGEVVRAEPFAAVEIELARLWTAFP